MGPHFQSMNSFSLELHLVHFNTSYSSFKEALEQVDGLGVVAVIFDAKKNNPFFAPFQVGGSKSVSIYEIMTYFIKFNLKNIPKLKD